MASGDTGWVVCEICESGTTDSVVIDTDDGLAIGCRSCWWDYIDASYEAEDLAAREYRAGRGF
jgi:hypothetical protein